MSNFIVQFPLNTELYQEDILNKRFEIGRKIYNSLVNVTQKRYKEMVKTKIYRSIKTELKEIYQSEDKSKLKRKKELCRQLNELYKQYGINEYSFHADVKNMQGDTMKKVKIPFDIMKEIINDYTLNNISVPQLNKKYHYSNTVLYRELRENNIQIKSFEDASRKYEINKNIFKQITEQSAYWMGFIVTDGSFQKRLNTYQLVIHLSNKDDNHLKKIREFIQPNVKITYTKENSCRIAFTNNEICKDIWKYGIGINKTKEVNLSECLIYNRDFWRGVVDGDGYLGYCENGNNKHRLEIVGSYSLLSYFVEYCKTIIPNFKNTVKSHKSIYVIHLGGNTAKTILKSLYENSNIYLDRKKEKYEEIIAL